MDTIIETTRGTVKVIRFNKPQKKNAIDGDMYLRVTKILNTAASDDEVSMVVLTGTGDFYSSGNDYSVSRPEGAWLQILGDFIKAFITFPKLLIAIVNGPAIGIAATTLALCDMVFASENAYFYTPFSKLQITAEGGSTLTFPRLIGQRKAAEMLLFNHKMTAKEGLESGFINRVYKPEELQSKAWEKIQEILKSFNKMIPMSTKCIRDGVWNSDLPVSSLVKGDIVHIKAGDVIPADIRIIESKGVVLCCGDLTALGRVAGLAARLQPEPSPLAREIRRFMRYMSIWALSLGVIIATASIILGYPFIQTTIFVIGMIVANIPEGLQPTITASLTLTAQRMVKKNCLVKNLEAIEALGAVTTICSDKTGTLTKNKMCVRHIWIWDRKYSVADPDFESTLQVNQALKAIKICGALCSTAVILPNGDIQGDASETAILNFLCAYDDPVTASVHLNKRLSRYVVVIKGAPECILSRCTAVVMENGNVNITNEVKKAADNATEDLANTGERVLAFADLILDPKEFPMSFDFDTEEINFPLEGLRLIGIIGLKDPPRDEVRQAIERVRAAGIRVMMVTGDHPATARAVAIEVGIATTAACHVITGNDLRNMTSDLLYLTLEKHHEIVFARTSPTQKLQIVEACQRQGSVVAVTGDGVNDAPALRRADIGISMGITGSQVSKQTADIILMDDNFATIVLGIEEGRKIFDNLKKSVCYILISNVPEVLPVFMFILFSIPLPLDLGTDMWPAVSLSYEKAEADVMERPPRHGDPLVSARMLRLVYGHLGLIEFAAGMYAYFTVMAEHGFYPADLFGIRERWDNEAVNDVRDSLGQEWTYAERKELERACQATYFIAVVITQMMNGVICKTRFNSIRDVGMKNHVLNIGLLFELVLAYGLCYLPGINNFFCTYPLRLQWLFLAIPFSALLLAFGEFRKYCIRKKLFGGWYNEMTFY
ncbi:unnamed protein product, partial [Iphiclides podalirius]